MKMPPRFLFTFILKNTFLGRKCVRFHYPSDDGFSQLNPTLPRDNIAGIKKKTSGVTDEIIANGWIIILNGRYGRG
jgi:hypothetical protein